MLLTAEALQESRLVELLLRREQSGMNCQEKVGGTLCAVQNIQRAFNFIVCTKCILDFEVL